MNIIVIESNNGCWNYAPADAPAAFLRCLRYDDTGLPSLESTILAAEYDETIPQPIHFTVEFADDRGSQ